MSKKHYEEMIYLAHTLDEVLAQLPMHSYTGTETWISEPYTTLHHYIAPAHQETIWNSKEFGVVLHRLEPVQKMLVLDEPDRAPF